MGAPSTYAQPDDLSPVAHGPGTGNVTARPIQVQGDRLVRGDVTGRGVLRVGVDDDLSPRRRRRAAAAVDALHLAHRHAVTFADGGEVSPSRAAMSRRFLPFCPSNVRKFGTARIRIWACASGTCSTFREICVLATRLEAHAGLEPRLHFGVVPVRQLLRSDAESGGYARGRCHPRRRGKRRACDPGK